MSTKSKWIVGIAAVLILFVLLICFSSRIYLWFLESAKTLLIWAILFIAGWVLGYIRGRGSRKKHEAAENA